MMLTSIFYCFFLLTCPLHLSSDIWLVRFETKTYFCSFFCIPHSTVAAKSLSGPSLDLLGITVGEIITTASI